MARALRIVGCLLVSAAAIGCSDDVVDGEQPGSSDASLPDANAFDGSRDTGSIFSTDSGRDAGADASDGATIDAGTSLVQPASLDFGLVNCGSTAAAKSFQVINTTAQSASWTATLAKGPASAFQLAPGSGTLSAGASATVTVTPTPMPASATTSADAYADAITVTMGATSASVALHETAQGAVLVFAPPSVGFGSVPISAGPQSLFFAVQNNGNATADVVLALGGDPAFTLPGGASTASVVAAPGAVVDTALTFAPTQTTTVSANVAMLLDADAGATVLCAPLPALLPVQGTGTNGQVVIGPGSITFGQAGLVPCGTTAQPASVSLKNSGSASLTWTAALSHGGSFYSVSPASGTLAAGATTSINVTPKTIPTSSSTIAGSFDDTLTVTTNVAGDAPHAIALHETPQGAIVARSTNSVAFGSIGSGGTSTNTTSVSFSNTGNVDATLSFANGNGAFVQTSPLTVGAGSFVGETVSFSPTTTGPYNDIGTVTLVGAGDAGAPPLCGALPGNLTLTGTGVTPTVTAAPGTLNFGFVPCGQAGQQLQTTITNNGPTTTFTAAPLKGAGSYFTVSPTSGTFASGASLPFVVTPKAIPFPGSTSSNFYGDTLQVVTGNGAIVDVTLTMTGLGAVITTSKASIAFSPPSVAVGTTASSAAFTISNGGTAPATVTLTPTTLTPFGVTPATAVTIPASGSNPFSATFTPTATGPASGGLAFSVSTDTLLCAALPANVGLTGTGN